MSDQPHSEVSLTNQTHLSLSARPAITMILGFSSLLYLSSLFHSLSSDSSRVIASGFGTAGLPYSDALIWLAGGLHAVFGLQQIDYLFRPTIGLFWGSIIAVTDRLESIPAVFFVIWSVMAVAFLVLWRNTSVGLVLAVWILLLTIGFDRSIVPLSPVSLTVDFAAFVFTAIGLFLVICGAQSHPLSILPTLVGGFVLGVSAAIRGPMIAGGFLFIVCMLAPRGKRVLKALLGVLLCFCIPIIGDVILQAHYHVVNNGMVSLYCVYSEPSRIWNQQCHAAFLANRPDLPEIVRNYATFIFSTPGAAIIYDGFAGRIRQDVLLFSSGYWAVGLLVFSFYVGRQIWEGKKRGEKISVQIPSLWLLAIFGMFLIAARNMQSLKEVFSLCLLLSCLFIAFKFKRWTSLSLLLGYMGACLFLTSLGLGMLERVALTFSFMLHFAILLLIIQPTGDAVAYTNGANHPALYAISGSVFAFIIVLYTFWALWPNELRSQYLAEVEGQNSALKLSDDKNLNRSLYFTGGHVLVHTFSDTLSIGAVRRYTALKYPARDVNDSNESFFNPNTFLD